MINGKITMSGEFGWMRVEAIVTYIKVLFHLLHLYDRKNREVAGHRGYPAYNLFQWHD
jgi:hypothetical protein